MGRVEADLEAETGRVDLRTALADLKLLKFAYGPAILGLRIKYVFFP